MTEDENPKGQTEKKIDEIIKELAKYDDEGYSRELDAKINEFKDELVTIGRMAVPRLIELLTDDGGRSATCAIRALGEIRDKRALPALADKLEDGGLAETAHNALKKFGPECIPEVIKRVEHRISNPTEDKKGLSTITMYSISTIGEVKCEESATFLIELLDDYISEMPDEPFDQGKTDWKYRNVNFFELLDAMVKQGDKRAIPHIRKARDCFPENYTDYKICQIAMGRIKMGETDGYLPLEVIDIQLPAGDIMEALTDGEVKSKFNFDKEYGKYFEKEFVKELEREYS